MTVYSNLFVSVGFLKDFKQIVLGLSWQAVALSDYTLTKEIFARINMRIKNNRLLIALPSTIVTTINTCKILYRRNINHAWMKFRLPASWSVKYSFCQQRHFGDDAVHELSRVDAPGFTIPPKTTDEHKFLCSMLIVRTIFPSASSSLRVSSQ